MQAKWTPIDCIALSKAILNIILIYSKMGLVKKKKKKKKHVLYICHLHQKLINRQYIFLKSNN